VRRADGSEAAIHWPVGERLGREVADPALLRLGEVTIWTRVAPDAMVENLRTRLAGDWSPVEAIRDGSTEVGSVWEDTEGNLVLPFDPREAIEGLWREAYLDRSAETSPGGWPLRAYYAIRPSMPRPAQIAMRRMYARVQARRAFPAWPAETALHDLYHRLFELIRRSARSPIPYLAPWPDGRDWAIVLTHDVETAAGYAAIPALRDVERSLGLRSSWNLVPSGYRVDEGLVEELLADGFEVGVHGFRHDGRDFASKAEFRDRLPDIRRCADAWRAVGFRAPSSLRVWEWMPELGFDYDSSYSDTAPFEPQAGGCCSLLPFFNEDLVELPITMPQDHTMFEVLGETDEGLWLRKAALIQDRNGMALMLTHPDYATPDRVSAYARLLETYRNDETAWWALPAQVSAWWRDRAASDVEPAGRSWRIVGPASARGRVVFA
jgi:peptidoglycan/xylan/chitin deacetylase (PgdA/CDA1 family)